MHSMTGFGRGSAATDAWLATIEISAVNRKQAEVVIQAPRELTALDARIRKEILTVISRGRIQVSINLERAAGTSTNIRVDTALAQAFAEVFAGLGKKIGYDLVPTAADFLRQPGIISAGNGEIDSDAAWTVIGPALSSALAQLVSMRKIEGTHLKEDIINRIDSLVLFAKRIATEAPDRPVRQRELLTKRLRDAGLELDLNDDRILREIAVFADRCDVSEELTRLDSHFSKFREYLDAEESPGRALDFLCQELFREFNTIGSKAYDAFIAQTIVEAKTELEKIREQIQNVE